MATPLTGQATCVGATTAVHLSSSPVTCTVFWIKAPGTNTNPVYIGGSTVTNLTGHQLDPGVDFVYQRVSQPALHTELQPSDLYVAGSQGDIVTWFASP